MGHTCLFSWNAERDRHAMERVHIDPCVVHHACPCRPPLCGSAHRMTDQTEARRAVWHWTEKPASGFAGHVPRFDPESRCRLPPLQSVRQRTERQLWTCASYAVTSPAPVEQQPPVVKADEPPVIHALRDESSRCDLSFRVSKSRGESQVRSLSGCWMRLP